MVRQRVSPQMETYTMSNTLLKFETVKAKQRRKGIAEVQNAAIIPINRKLDGELRKSKCVGFDRLPADLTTNSWITPPEIVEVLGPFDLDPCADFDMPWPTAKVMLTKKQDGLATPWAKRDYALVNPPYSREPDGTDIGDWMDKLAQHGHGIALIFARVDTKWFHRTVFNHPNATSLVICHGRLKFCRRDGTQDKPAPVGSVFVAYGKKADTRLKAALKKGVIKGAYLQLAGRLQNFGSLPSANDSVGGAA